ncbi:PAXNEB protein-domain-containing protein, partial [Baffinella frigidus]
MAHAMEPKKSVFRRAAPTPSSSAPSPGIPAPPGVGVSPAGIQPLDSSLRGTKASVFSKHVLTSTGLAGLDASLGGGLALGTVVCVVEDSPSAVHSVLLRHVVAQGLAHGQSVLLCQADGDARLAETLPSPMAPQADEMWQPLYDGGHAMMVGKRAGHNPLTAVADDELRIAWRYKESMRAPVAQGPANGEAPFSHKLDLSKPLRRVPADKGDGEGEGG